MPPEIDATYTPEHANTGAKPLVIYKVLLASTVGVREGLREVTARLFDEGYAAEDVSIVELVLAETLNNIVEHAYEDRGAGEIALHVTSTHDALDFRVTDFGKEMPDGEPPEGAQADLDCATEDLPEGGFGWFLIRELTHNLRYSRENTANVFAFGINVKPPSQPSNQTQSQTSPEQ